MQGMFRGAGAVPLVIHSCSSYCFSAFVLLLFLKHFIPGLSLVFFSLLLLFYLNSRGVDLRRSERCWEGQAS